MIKVEDTGQGDYVRWAPPYYGSEEHTPLGTRSAIYLALNRNKRSIRLDLKQEGGRRGAAQARRVGATSWSRASGPACSTSSGSATTSLRQANPALVYCPITGYGQDGPNRDRAGHDMNYLGLNGMLGPDRRGRRTADPVRRRRSPTSAAAA